MIDQLVKVTRGGQITLPATIRRAAGIDIGDYVEVSVTDEGLVLKVKHLLLADELDDKLATELMNIALNHAYQNDFQKVEIEESVFKWLAKDHAAFAPRGLA